MLRTYEDATDDRQQKQGGPPDITNGEVNVDDQSLEDEK